MSMMDRIDNRLDVAIRQLQENPESTVLAITLKLAAALPDLAVPGLSVPGLALVDSLLEHFSTNKRIERIHEVLFVLKDELQALQSQYIGDKQTLEAIGNYLKSPEFSEALIATAEEAVRNTNAERNKRLARVLANGSDPNIEPSNEDDLTSFIRDVSQLSEGDIQVLKQLASSLPLAIEFATGSQKVSSPESTFQQFFDDTEREKLLTEDFYSHCFRLVGFGLAAQIPGNSPSQFQSKYLFRLTRRGHRLHALLTERTYSK
jgi:hypothetical protein